MYPCLHTSLNHVNDMQMLTTLWLWTLYKKLSRVHEWSIQDKNRINFLFNNNLNSVLSYKKRNFCAQIKNLSNFLTLYIYFFFCLIMYFWDFFVILWSIIYIFTVFIFLLVFLFYAFFILFTTIFLFVFVFFFCFFIFILFF